MNAPQALLYGLTAQQAPDAAEPGCPYASLIPIGLMLMVIYFLLIRPQVKQQRQHSEMVSGLKKGDEVVTQGGLIGKVTSVSDRVVTLEVTRDVKVRVLKTQVAGPYAEAPGQAGGAPQQSGWESPRK